MYAKMTEYPPTAQAESQTSTRGTASYLFRFLLSPSPLNTPAAPPRRRDGHASHAGARIPERGEQYLLIKSPPAWGKTRALMYVALDKLPNQGVKQASSWCRNVQSGQLRDEPLRQAALGRLDDSRAGTYATRPGRRRPRRQVKVKAVGEFLGSEDKVSFAPMRPSVLPWTNMALRHSITASLRLTNSITSPATRQQLGSQLIEILGRTAHVVAMTGSYFAATRWRC